MSYLVLPSNSSLSYFPDNKPGHFFTKLPRPLDFNEEYEVGLSEILFSNTYSNIFDHEMYFKFRVNSAQEKQTVSIPSGLYESVNQLVSVMVGKCIVKWRKDIKVILKCITTQ